MALFRRSTRAIVTGRRSRAEKKTLGQEDSANILPVSKDNAAAQETPYGQKTGRWKKWRLSVKNCVTKPAFIIIVVIAALIPGLILIVTTPFENAAPKVAEGQVIIAVSSDSALASQVDPGDVVQLYSIDGYPIPELQYVQVYKSTSNAGLLLLVDENQAAALIRQEISTKVALVTHDDSDRAVALLDLQQRINHPDITITLQSAVTLSPQEAVVLQIKTTIQPEEAVLPKIEWFSSNPTVATVDNGIVTAHRIGKATLTVVCGDISACCIVTVIK